MLAGLCYKESGTERAQLGSHNGLAWTLIRSLRSTINYVVRGTEYWHWRFLKSIGASSWLLRVNVAPKNAQNFEDKGEGARPTRLGKDSGDAGPVGRRPASGVKKLCGKTRGGTAKDVKDTTSVALPDPRWKGKSQPAITNFMISGAQESGIESSSFHPTDMSVSVKENCKTHREEIGQAKESKEGSSGSNSHLTGTQDAEGGLVDDLSNAKEQRALNGANVRAPNSGSMQLQTVEPKHVTHVAHVLPDMPPALSLRNLMEGGNDGNNAEMVARKTGRSKKVPDWSRDGGDKFYSLTEGSEATSS
ncbi:hypothetical protein NDU88_004804 [Pleurodeles waltl]|uniref:Uncharacterized protein n=1 Tax=Pleurodeles waltl TaxID=8319 RepID=A0AAV7M7C9_PLEWA|nr:hypothetical protein NDU88_004804 [Pleurodeles waltl]